MIESGAWLGKSDLEKNLKSPGPTIVLFAAEWCGYCRRFISMMKTFQTEQPRKVSIVDADSEGGSLWDDYRLDLVPTVVVFKNGAEIFRRNGRPGAGLEAKDLQDALNAA
jgi:thioredoxin 1